jgi:hypothetical protein
MFVHRILIQVFWQYSNDGFDMKEHEKYKIYDAELYYVG